MYRHVVNPKNANWGFIVGPVGPVHLHNTTSENGKVGRFVCGTNIGQLFSSVVGKGKNLPTEQFTFKGYIFNPKLDYCKKCFPQTKE